MYVQATSYALHITAVPTKGAIEASSPFPLVLNLPLKKFYQFRGWAMVRLLVFQDFGDGHIS